MARETERGEGAEPECFWRILKRAEKSACKRAGGATGGPTWANISPAREYLKRDSVTKQRLRGDPVVLKRDKGSPCHGSKRDKWITSFPPISSLSAASVERSEKMSSRDVEKVCSAPLRYDPAVSPIIGGMSAT